VEEGSQIYQYAKQEKKIDQTLRLKVKKSGPNGRGILQKRRKKPSDNERPCRKDGEMRNLSLKQRDYCSLE
jgi:hypothetical protein